MPRMHDLKYKHRSDCTGQAKQGVRSCSLKQLQWHGSLPPETLDSELKCVLSSRNVHC